MRGFVRSYVAPSRLTGKLARWVSPICPLVIGLQPDEKLAVRERIMKNARSVGAPVAARQDCRPNVIVVFAMNPQELTTKVIEERWNLGRTVFGDIDGRIHARKLSKISSPLQAWYGTTVLDARNLPGSEESAYLDVSPYCWAAKCYAFEASNLNNGIKSVLSTVFVVVDLGKVSGRETGTIADYVTMLALSQTDAFATCRNMPSVTNFLTQDCDANLKTAALSDADHAFLRGVYKTRGGDNINLAMGDIVREMEKSLPGRDVKVPAQPGSTASTPAK